MKGDRREGVRETKGGCKAEKKGFGGQRGARVTSEWAGDLGEASSQGPESPHLPTSHSPARVWVRARTPKSSRRKVPETMIHILKVFLRETYPNFTTGSL